MKKAVNLYHVRDIRTNIWCSRCQDRPAVKEVRSYKGARELFCRQCYLEFRALSPEYEFREKQK